MKGVLSAIKFIAKWGIYAVAIVKILEFAHKELTEIENQKDVNDTA